MINDEVLIKVLRRRGHKDDWPEEVIKMRGRIYNIKIGFPGIKSSHLSLIEKKDIHPGDLYIYDQYIELGDGYGDEAPIMFKSLGNGMCRIEGIGCGIDSKRDPHRIKLRWMDELPEPEIPDNFLVCRVDPRPDLNGGSGYYYFFRSYRDFRY